YGMANLDAGTPITADTVFNLASVSKQFTAFSIALLAREGKIDLQADIRNYLPNLPDFGECITVSDLVHHTSGMRDYIALAALSGHDDESLLRQRHAIAILERQRGLNFAPRTHYEYSNSGYALLAEIVRAVSGQTLNEFMKARIFAPLGMQHTRVRDDLTRIEPGYAAGYEEGGDGRPWARAVYNRVAVGPGNLLSTVGDLAKWAGNFARPVVGDSQFIDQLSAPAALRDGTPVNYGFGLTRQTVIGHRVVTHDGGISGFRTTFAFFPDDDFAIVILANRPLALDEMSERVAAIYLQPKPVSSPRWPATTTAKASVVSSLAGDYQGSEGALLTLRQDGKQVVASSYGKDQGSMTFWVDGTFGTSDYDDKRFRVVKEQGVVVGLDAIDTDNDGERVLRLKRVTRVAPSAAELAALAGDYHAEEVDTTYTVSIESGKVTLRSLYLDAPQNLQPSVIDRFEALDGPLGGLIVSAVRASDGQAAALLFQFGRNTVRLSKQPERS
ncbi:MAG TPA: serine hydrolase domain-containing protein, partial [Steroidobacter sp.]